MTEHSKARRRRPTAVVRVGILAAVIFAVVIFPASSLAVPAPKLGLAGVSAPTNLPPVQNSVQRLTVTASSGSYSLTPTTAQGTGTLASPALAFGTLVEGSPQVTSVIPLSGNLAVGQTLDGAGVPTGTTIVSLGAGTITLSAPATVSESFVLLSAGSEEIGGVHAAWGQFHAGDEISGDGIPPGTTVTAVGPETLSLSAPTTEGGVQELTASEASGPISPGAPAGGTGSIEEELHALPGATGISVEEASGSAPGERIYFFTFGGLLADTDVPQMRVDGASLGGSDPRAIISTRVPGGTGTGSLVSYVENLGGAAIEGTTRIEVHLPEGITARSAPDDAEWSCGPVEGGLSSLTCETTEPVQPGSTMTDPLSVPLEVGVGAAERSDVELSATNPGADAATTVVPIVVSQTPAKPGIASFAAGSYTDEGLLDSRAAAHPFTAITAFFVRTVRSPRGVIVPAGDPKEVDVALPPGFLGNPLATPRCPASASVSADECPLESIVGITRPLTGYGASQSDPVFNLQPSFGSPAEFRFFLGSAIATFNVAGEIRSDGDYGVTVASRSTPQILPVYGVFFTFWGTPASPAHDSERCILPPYAGSPGQRCGPGTGEEIPFLTNPGDCAEEARVAPITELSVDSWQSPAFDHAAVRLPPVTGCEALGAFFHPTLSFQPESSRSATGSAFSARLEVPQAGLLEPEGRGAPALRKAVVTLPAGVDVNPASAAGLEACSEAQMGLTTTVGEAPDPIRFDKGEPACPDASKIGTVQAKSPLLEEPLDGTIYLASQEENPFHSLLALYLVIESPKNGILVKLAGEVRSDPGTGRLTAVFDDNPQLPVEDLTLDFRGGGPRSPLATPEVCGTYTTHGELTPWSAPESGPPVQAEDSFAISGGPDGGACPTTESGRPFAPSFEAGTTSTQAGAYSPLVIKVGRKDGEQELSSLDFTLPEGLTGRLAGIPYCSGTAIEEAEGKSGKAEQASASCPSASQIGIVDTTAGVGTEPIHVAGKVYLAGPYKGAPLSSVVVTPAVAGPFDLGDVVIQAPLFVDPETSQITARSDPIPTILRGIPLKVRSIAITLDRTGFTLNPTSCDAMALTARLAGSSGATAVPESRFQVSGCKSLAFKPKLTLNLSGSTGHTGHPRLKAVVRYPTGGSYSNIARAQVNLPHSEFLDQSNLNNTCTRPVLLAGNCPKSTIYGTAKAWTPLLEKPLVGHVYLVGGYGYKLPALVADLNGQIRVVLKGKIDSGPNGGIRNTFEALPDAPISRFVLEIKGGERYGLLENSENLCARPQKAISRFTAHNGAVRQAKLLVGNQCPNKKRDPRPRK